MSTQVGCCLLLLTGAQACQEYPFELRQPERVEARRINEVIKTIEPTDVLFVIDNSGSMVDEKQRLRQNFTTFIEALASAATDFQVGIVAPDVECNVPNRSCLPGGASKACCDGPPAACEDSDTDGDQIIDYSTCDRGRLRAADGRNRIFGRPEEGKEAEWVVSIQQTLDALGCQGSAYEAAFEAARLAIACATDDTTCPEPAVAALNKGFIRDNADLVVIFVTDEDDCSFTDPLVYSQLFDPSSADEQERGLCSSAECYAYYGKGRDGDQDGLMDWADPNPGPQLFKCDGKDRKRNPPEPMSVSDYLDELIALKGGDVTRLRAAAISGGVLDDGSELGFTSSACFNAGVGPSNACGCWSTTSNKAYCEVTGAVKQMNDFFPNRDKTTVCNIEIPNDGCNSMPSHRYVEFLELLAARRRAANVGADTLIDSICRSKYDETMFKIVNTVILTNCFDMGQVPAEAGHITVRRNGEDLPRVEPASGEEGWSWRDGAGRVCLEGELRKEIADEYEIFVLATGE